MNASLSQETFWKIRDFIRAKSGLSFPNEKKYLIESRLVFRLQAVHCRTYEEYFNFVRYDPSREQELIQLLNCVTTNETFFFRDTSQIDCFRRVILPQAIQANEKRRELRIWSAGCSSGEEPYTLAMVIAEEFPNLIDWDVQIMATDLSEQVLLTAAKGLYGPYSVRNIPPAYLQKYFTSTDGQYFIRPILKQYVKFSRLNLFDSLQMRTMKDIDVLFCRNVLIYFDQEVRKRILSQFYDSLKPSGTLIIGFSESLSGLNRLFRPLPWHKTFFYTKVDQPVLFTLPVGSMADGNVHLQTTFPLNGSQEGENSFSTRPIGSHLGAISSTNSPTGPHSEECKFKGKVS